mgnify:CR=1 FL=1
MISFSSARDVTATLGYRVYEAYLRRQMPESTIVRHLGVILDGNRRWGASSTVDFSSAYRAGGRKIISLVDWCEESSVDYVTVWILSTDNLSRADAELTPIYQAISETLDQLRQRPNTRIVHIGALDQLPADVCAQLKEAEEETCERGGITVNMAIGYGGKQEITDALKSWLSMHSSGPISLDELAMQLTPDDLEEHTYTHGQPPLDLIIRTSGEQRLSGFMLWHSTYAELYFCEALWPDFRRIDLLRAFRSYARRQRRFGR